MDLTIVAFEKEIGAEKSIRLVNERLEFVEIIDQLNPVFLEPKLIRHTPEGGWTHPWKYFDSLRNYLLLTCFDLLGQPTEFKDFQSWLEAKSSFDERAEVEKLILSGLNTFERAARIHRSYLQIHGARIAFLRFINEILTAEERVALLYSVRIRRIDPVKNTEVDIIENDQSKVDWLYRIRSQYTHRAENTGSPSGGVFGSLTREIVIDGKVLMGWEPISWEEKSGFRIEYGVRNWPRALKRAVRSGMAARFPDGKA